MDGRVSSLRIVVVHTCFNGVDSCGTQVTWSSTQARYLGVRPWLDTGVEAGGAPGRRLGVGPQVDDDGPSRVEPGQRALGTTQVDLLHVPHVGLVTQATTCGKKREWKKVVFVF